MGNAYAQLVYKYLKDGQQILLQQEEVLHIPDLDFDGIKGYSPIHMAREAIGLALATEEFGSRFFANPAYPQTDVGVRSAMEAYERHKTI